VARWQVIVGKCLGQSAILGVATVLGYGAAAAVLWARGSVSGSAWQAFGAMVLASVLLGVVFVAIGCLASTLVRERATAAGMAVGVWLFFVLLYDTAVLGALVVDQGRVIGKDMLDVLLLLNPTDVYRLFNMTATESVSVYSGMAGPGDPAALPPPVYLAVLLLWALVPLGLAVLAFSRRPV
jgi:Cu-processing system permease protein